MTRRIMLSQIGDYATDRYEQLLRATVLETDSRLKQGSPVDTGRFRASWQVSENSTAAGQKPPGDYAITPIERIAYQDERVGNVYHVHNNLPYAEPLAGGPSFPPSWKAAGVTGSKQAPAGWVDLIAREMTAWVQQQADRIGRQR